MLLCRIIVEIAAGGICRWIKLQCTSLNVAHTGLLSMHQCKHCQQPTSNISRCWCLTCWLLWLATPTAAHERLISLTNTSHNLIQQPYSAVATCETNMSATSFLNLPETMHYPLSSSTLRPTHHTHNFTSILYFNCNSDILRQSAQEIIPFCHRTSNMDVLK